MTVDTIGTISADINGPLEAYCAALAAPTTPAPFTTSGEMFFVDLYRGVWPQEDRRP